MSDLKAMRAGQLMDEYAAALTDERLAQYSDRNADQLARQRAAVARQEAIRTELARRDALLAGCQEVVGAKAVTQ
jgi:hypothetical protein